VNIERLLRGCALCGKQSDDNGGDFGNEYEIGTNFVLQVLSVFFFYLTSIPFSDITFSMGKQD
jgi:hypothetical protein